MTKFQFNLILALLFLNVASGSVTPAATVIGYTFSIACGLVALVYAFLERKS